MKRKNRYTKEYLEPIVIDSKSKKDLLDRLGLRNAGGNFSTIKKYIILFNIDISHFVIKQKEYIKSLKDEEVMVENSSFSRASLKKRLYNKGLKERKCEMCGQGEEWNGKHMSLILDHINGIWNDNRLENLRIVCPNCNSTLDTHCGKNKTKGLIKDYGDCICCGVKLKSKYNKSKMCTTCNSFQRRKIERPSKEILNKEVDEFGFCAIGRKYGVSDNTIRKWLYKSIPLELVG